MTDPTGEFFDELGRKKHEPMLRKATGVLSFDISDGTSTAHWSVVVKKGDVSVSRAHDEADCTVTTDRPLFDAIVRARRMRWPRSFAARSASKEIPSYLSSSNVSLPGRPSRFDGESSPLPGGHHE